jgi:hypothetical protein
VQVSCDLDDVSVTARPKRTVSLGFRDVMFEFGAQAEARRMPTSRRRQSNGKEFRMPLYPTPHSPEWFAAVQETDPTQAVMAHSAIQIAGGSTDVCGMCGDDSPADYQVVNPAMPKYAVATLRLCEECHQVREEGGEKLLPYP